MSDASDPTFADLGLRPELLQSLTALGYEEPTPIQREAIIPLLAGRDLLGQAATGTGKTAAFALPMLQRLSSLGAGKGPPKALVLAPTRELATQVSEAIHKYGRGMGARVLPIYGGQPFTRQLRSLQNGVDIVVATPGRALDHIGRRTMRVDALEIVVLDEADEMLDMGFTEDIEAILADAPDARQTVLFSATMPKRIQRIANAHLTDPVRIDVGAEATAPGEAPKVRQIAYIVPRAHKPAALSRVLDVEQPTATLVFCRTRAEVDNLTETLNGRGYRAEALHGGLSQDQRTKVLGRLKSGASELIVATDVAARGLDIDQLTHVVNYDVPAAPEAYVHRIGRVGRAGREGVAITLAQPREHRMLKTIERVTGSPIAVEKVPTVADLRARRMEATRAALQESLVSDDLASFSVIVESLAEEHDVMEIAMAAVRIAHEATVGSDDAEDEDIPQGPPPRDSRDPRGKDHKSKPKNARRGPAGDTTNLFIGAGRVKGVRPQDLVGAICGETRLQGRDIGAIDISDRFALVEIPADAADEVIAALQRTKIKGHKAPVRLERDNRGNPKR